MNTRDVLNDLLLDQNRNRKPQQEMEESEKKSPLLGNIKDFRPSKRDELPK